MKIIVCIKQVPNTNKVKIDPVTNTLIREGVESIINPDDKAGLEAALKLKDKHGAYITCLSMGPPQADLALREALAMGADEAVLITDRAFGGSDTLATSSILASALKKLDFDLIITGRQAIDGDTAQVGPQIAEHLGLVNISYAEDIEVEGGYAFIKSAHEDRTYTVKAALPCLVTALTGMNEPRYMTVSGIFDAYREQKVKIFTKEDLDVDDTLIGLKGSPTKVIKSFPKEAKGTGQIINMSTEDSVKWLMEKLKEKFIIGEG